MLVRSFISRSGRRTVPSIARTMATTSKNIYLLPIDPTAPHAAADVDTPALWSSVPAAPSGKPAKAGTSHLFFAAPAPGDVAVVTSLGDLSKAKGDAKREVVRKAVASGVGKVKSLGEAINGRTAVVDAQADPHAAGASILVCLIHDN